jgi:hypothetical protein
MSIWFRKKTGGVWNRRSGSASKSVKRKRTGGFSREQELLERGCVDLVMVMKEKMKEKKGIGFVEGVHERRGEASDGDKRKL